MSSCSMTTYSSRAATGDIATRSRRPADRGFAQSPSRSGKGKKGQVVHLRLHPQAGFLCKGNGKRV